MPKIHRTQHSLAPHGFFSLITALMLLMIISISGCNGLSDNNMLNKSKPIDIVHPQFSAGFESASLGAVSALDASGHAWNIAVKNDNNDANLPASYRTWFYFRADDVPTNSALRLELSDFGFPYYFIPVYSYDQKNWQYFHEDEVVFKPNCTDLTQKDCGLIINKRFDKSTVWIARTFPYTTNDLSVFLDSITRNPHVRIQTLGKSPNGQPIRMITIGDHQTGRPAHFAADYKKTVWINARTHPAETGPSFLLEGLIHTVLANDRVGKYLRQHYVFKIVPMHNVDGVAAGNYRTNTSSINLEHRWFFDEQSSPYLNDQAAMEDKLLNSKAMVPILRDQKNPPVLALNLHSSNSTPDTAAFFFPHFGIDPIKYNQAEQALWQMQDAFIKAVASHYHGKIEQPPKDGGSGFLNSAFPESWWWEHKGSAVNAITLETTYGRAGFDHWVSSNDLRELGVAVALAIADINDASKSFDKDDVSMFSLPFNTELYGTDEGD